MDYNRRLLLHNNVRKNTVTDLIVNGLGYCCEMAFFSHYRNTPADLIAARLGVAKRTIHRHQQSFAEGECQCTKAANCLASRLRKPTPSSST